MNLNIRNVLTIVLIWGFNASDAKDCPDDWTVDGTSCYLFGHQSLSFFSAESYCSQHQAHLVHINDDQENTFIREHVRYMKGERWWIGLTDDDVENTWKWYVTNETPEYTDWTPGQPDDARNNEDCVEFNMQPSIGGHWNDVPCDVHFFPICERPFDDTSNTIVG